MFGNIPTKILKQCSDVCNAILRDIWNFEILEKQNFPQNLKLADITTVYKKKDSTLVDNHQSVHVFPTVITFLKGLSRDSFKALLMTFYFLTYVVIEKVLTPNSFFHVLKNGKNHLI